MAHTTVPTVTVAGAFLHLDVAQRAGCRRGNLGVNLVGGDLKEGLVAGDGVAGLLEPLGERAFGDGFAHLGHNDVDWPWEGSPGDWQRHW